MQFTTLFVAAFASLVAAQSHTCFDDGDCIFNGGGHCIKTGTGLAGILGTCAPKGATTLVTATSTAAPTGTAAAGKGTCFDDGDCLLYAGTHCVKTGTGLGAITGTCK